MPLFFSFNKIFFFIINIIILIPLFIFKTIIIYNSTLYTFSFPYINIILIILNLNFNKIFFFILNSTILIHSNKITLLTSFFTLIYITLNTLAFILIIIYINTNFIITNFIIFIFLRTTILYSYLFIYINIIHYIFIYNLFKNLFIKRSTIYNYRTLKIFRKHYTTTIIKIIMSNIFITFIRRLFDNIFFKIIFTHNFNCFNINNNFNNNIF